MSIMLPYLIVGSDQQTRLKKALSLAKQDSTIFDTHIINGKVSAGIADIRTVNERLSHRPFESKYQTVIIDEAQHLTLEAQNAFLKTLEESPPSAKIILTAPTPESLISTVVSRCQKTEISQEPAMAINWNFFINILDAKPYERYLQIDKLDIDNWLAAWREITLALLSLRKVPFRVEGDLTKVIRYVKLISKVKSLQKRKANLKLLKMILLLEVVNLKFTS